MRIPSSLTSLLLFACLIGATVYAYNAHRRRLTNEKVFEANKAIAAAVLVSVGGAKSREAVVEAMNDGTFERDRATLTARGREAQRKSKEAAEAYTAAADKLTAAVESAHDETNRTYWLMMRDATAKRAESATEAARCYAVVADETLPDLVTMRARMTPFADRAEAARAVADRLNAQATQFQ